MSRNCARIAANFAAQNPLVVKNALSIRLKRQFWNIVVSSVRANQKVGIDDAVEREQVKNIVFNPRAVAFFVDRFFDLVFRRFASREFEFTRFYVRLELKKVKNWLEKGAGGLTHSGEEANLLVICKNFRFMKKRS